MTPKRLIVIGAGPIGVAAALGGVDRGWDVKVLEADCVGASLLRWGPTKFFSPLAMNLPPGARRILGSSVPLDDALLTGRDFVETVLAPLAESKSLAGRIHVGHRVIGVGRCGLTRCDLPGHPVRAERPFRVLADSGSGERVFEAEFVVDASGTYGCPAALGVGGLPARGERSTSLPLIRDLGTLEEKLAQLRGRQVLLAGHGHSAANALLMLQTIADRESDKTRVTWATRSMNHRPCVAVYRDPLPERARVVSQANGLAVRPPAWLKVERRASVERIAADGAVELTGGRTAAVQCIVALTGYRPDTSFLSELAIELSPVTEGAARLARALASVTDCLSVPALLPSDLDSGEPGFHLAGAKSYGRARTFLLQNGYAQLESILAGLDTSR